MFKTYLPSVINKCDRLFGIYLQNNTYNHFLVGWPYWQENNILLWFLKQSKKEAVFFISFFSPILNSKSSLLLLKLEEV